MLRRLLIPTALVVAAATVMPAGGAPKVAATPGSATSQPGTTRGFRLVGHTTIGNRGMNSPVAVAGPCVYVGDRGDRGGIAIVDASNPRRPRVVGKIPPVAQYTQREMRADRGLGLLVVENLGTDGGLVGNFKIYDISNCRKPKLLSTLDTSPRPPHEFFLWRDRKHPGRALLYATFTLYSPDLEVIDISNPRQPLVVGAYDIAADIAKNPAAVPNSGSGYLHSISVNDDGTRAYMGTWDFGVYIADTSTFANGSVAGQPGAVAPVSLPLSYAGDVHGAVPVPGRPLLVAVDETYAGAGRGCDANGFGWLRTISVANERVPSELASFRIPESVDCALAKERNGTFTAHNQTAFHDVVFTSWYSGGLRAVDISNPAKPREAGAFVPKRYFTPDQVDTRLYFRGAESDPFVGAMWSYPVVQDGLLYVVDIDLGLFILSYTGKWASEVKGAGFVEGNSAPSRYKRSDPVIKRAKPIAPGPATYLKDPTPVGRRRATKPYGFICVL